MILNEFINLSDAAEDNLTALVEIGRALSKATEPVSKALGKSIKQLADQTIQQNYKQYRIMREYFIAHEPPGTIRTV